jgi:TetR/AcrR family transcriptional regulator, mexJK operon transcriptional repressor
MSQPDPLSTTAVVIPAKRQQIVAGARQVFTELGFERASVDLIASRAGVSKATIYNHYEDKKALFVACIAQDAEDLRAGLRGCLGEPAGDVQEGLQLIGEKTMRVFLSPPIVALYRHIIAEAGRFPDLGRMIFDRGPSVIHGAIASYLERWDRTGALRIDDPRAAAVQFLALCQGDLLSRARLAVLEYPVDDEVRETVKRAVRTFVRAYRA